MDFFDSAVDEIDESDVYNESLTAGLATPILIVTAFTVGVEGYLRLEHSKALKNYERANPDLIPFRKLRKVTESLSEVSKGGAVKKELNPLSGFIQKLASQVGASKKELLEVFMNGDDCVFIIRTIGPKQVKMYAGNCPKKHHMYYFASWANKSGVYSDELTKWFKKWVGPNNKNGDEQGGENKNMDKVKKESVDDFFDSMTASLIGSESQNKDFFETAFDDILGEDNHVEESVDDFSDDDDLVTEKISISGSIAATLLLRLIGSAFRKTSTSIKVSVKINPALKNYEKANSDVIPFKDLVKKSVSTKSIADDDSDDAKKVKKMLAGATSVDFYFKSKEEAQAGENPIIAFTFTKASNPVTGSGSKSASIFQVSSEAKKHLEYYFNAYLTKHGMVGDPKLNAWVDEWGKKKDDDTMNEDVDDLEMDFDLGSEFFSESSVTNLIMAPLSKLRSNMAKHSLKRNAGASKRFAEKYKKNILCDGNVAEIEKLFLDLTDEVEGFLNKCDSVESSSFYKETNAALKEATQKFYGSVNRTKRTEYNPVKLNDEILRSNDVVTNACNKIARIVEGLRNKDLDPDAARAVSKCLSTVDSAGSTVFSKYRKFMSKYHPDIIKMDAEAKAYSTGFATGTVAAKY